MTNNLFLQKLLLIPRSIAKFIYFWYVESASSFWQKVLGFYRAMESELGIWANITHWWEPLYQDYTKAGRVIGPIFRTGRIILGLIVYLIILVISFCIFLSWIVLPALVFVMIIRNTLTL